MCKLEQNGMSDNEWPDILGEALHDVCTLFCTATGKSPHEAFLLHHQKIPPIPSPGHIQPGEYTWLHKFVRNKNDPTGEMVQVAAAYPNYAVISHLGGFEMINWKHLAPHPGPLSGQSLSSQKKVLEGADQARTPEVLSPEHPENTTCTPEIAHPPSMPTVPKPEESSVAAEESCAEQQSGYKTCYGRVVKEPT